MDGAVSDGVGEPYPLVSTTGKNVIGNMTNSLESYVQSGGTRRQVVVASSQKLTPLRKRKLSHRAREL